MSDRTEETPPNAHTVRVDVQLTLREVALISEALDSHIYWQLSDEYYRRDGFVREPGSDQAENAEQIVEAEALLRRLEPVRQNTTNDESS